MPPRSGNAMTPTARMMGALVPGAVLYSRADVQALQDRINRGSLVIDRGASTCVSLDAATLQSWRLTGYVPAQQYASADVPSALNVPALNAMYEQGQSLRSQLEVWAERLSQAGCSVPLAKAPAAYQSEIAAAKFVVGSLVVLAGLGLAIKVASIIEKVES